GDFAGAVSAVLRIDPVGGIARYQPGFNGPDHKAIPCVAAPKGAVAVEDGDLRISGEYGIVEFFASILLGGGGVQRGHRMLLNLYSERLTGILHGGNVK